MTTRELVDLSGLVTLRSDLIADGYTDRQIATLVKAGELQRIRHGAYARKEVWDSLSVADQHRLRSRAVLARSHPDTVLTHVSAALEHGAPVWGVSLDRIHTTRLDGKSGRLESDRRQHRGVLPLEQTVAVNGVRVSAPDRCAVEMTTITGVEAAMVTVDGLLHDKLTTLDDVVALAHDTRYWPHSLRTTVVLRLTDGRHSSAGESRSAFMCYDQHLPKPEPQVPILDEWGQAFAHVDFAWVEEGVFLEFDGRIKYEKYRREGETLEEYLMREKKREERICQLTGWVCIRITWEDLAVPALTARRIRAILDSRTKRGA